MPKTPDIRREPAGDPTGRALVDAMVAEVEALYGPAPDGWPSASPEEMGPPHGGFVVLYAGQDPVAGGGVKRLAAGVAEIKRMYVVPAARGRGHARRLLTALEELGRELGYAHVRLDTGDRQPHAKALYESAGYRPVVDYNGNVRAAFWYEKEL